MPHDLPGRLDPGRAHVRRRHPPDVPTGQRAGRHRHPRDPRHHPRGGDLRPGGRRRRSHRGHAEPVRHRRRRDDRRARPPAPSARSASAGSSPSCGPARRRPSRGGCARSRATCTPSSVAPAWARSGMCFTGGFALAMTGGPAVVAPVLCQPSTPFAIGPTRSRDVNLSPADLDIVKGRCAAGQQVLGVRYRKDPAVGKRFETLTTELGDAFIRVELEGKGPLDRDRPPLAGGRRRRARVLRRAAALTSSSSVGPAQDRGAPESSGDLRTPRSRPRERAGRVDGDPRAGHVLPRPVQAETDGRPRGGARAGRVGRPPGRAQSSEAISRRTVSSAPRDVSGAVSR